MAGALIGYIVSSVVSDYVAVAAVEIITSATLVGGVVGAIAGGVVAGAVNNAINGQPAAPQSVGSNRAQGILLNAASNVEGIPVIYGSRKVGGSRVLVESSGSANEYLHCVIALCEGEVGAIANVYINDILSTDSKYAGLVTVELHTGTDAQAASAALIAAIPTKWTSAHTGSGIAYVYVKFKYDSTVFSGLPVITCDVQGKKVYDPRTMLTAYSNNPALCIRDYLTNPRYGRGIASGFIDDASFILAANRCDELVTVPGGTQARYTCDGVVDVNQTAFDNIKSMLTCCRGMLVYSGGMYKLVLDYAQAATFAFTEDNIVGDWSITNAGRRSKFNRVSAGFFNAGANWQPDFGIVDSTAYRTVDNGLLLENKTDLPFTSNIYRAQQLAGLTLKQSRFGISVRFTAMQEALRAEVGDVVSITHTTPGWTAKLFRVTEIAVKSNDEVEITAFEYDATVYNLDTLTAITGAPGSNLPNVFSVVAPDSLLLSSGTSELLLNGDGTVTSRLKVSWTPSVNIFSDKLEIQYQKSGVSTWQTFSITDATAGASWIWPVQDGALYNVRIRYINTAGIASSWAYSSNTIIGKTAPPATPTNVSATRSLVYWTKVPDLDLAGYYVRAIPGSAALWGAGTPLHDGLVTSIPFAINQNLYGVQTIMVVARDTTGNISGVASVTFDFSSPTVGTVVQSLDYQGAGYPGTISNGTVSGTLQATVAAANDVYGLADEFSQLDLYAATYNMLQYVSTAFVPRYNGTVVLSPQVTGSYVLEYQIDGGLTNDAFALADDYAAAELFGALSAWSAWPGALDVKRGQGMFFRLTVAGGPLQGVISNMTAYFTMATVRQSFGITPLAAGGSRLSPSNGNPAYASWVQINTVQVTPIADGSGAVGGQVLEINPTLGPVVQLLNAAGNTVSGTSTIDIGGLVDV